MAAGTALALGGGLLGAISGMGGDEQTTTRNVAPPSTQEIALQNESFNNYMKQLALANQGEDAISGGAGVQNGARGSLEDIFGGGAFNLTPDEQARIQSIRDATVAAGTGDIQNFVNQNLSGVSNMAGARGVRGQALSELQGRSIGEGARQIGNLTAQANLTAAQQAATMPMQRVGIVGSLANQNSNFQEQLRQNAINNRQMLQNPVLMNKLQADRLGSASQTTTGSGGGVGSILGGALGGAGSTLGAYGNYNTSQAMANYYDTKAKTPGMWGGGVVKKEDGFIKNARQFSKGFNEGEDVSQSIENIRKAIFGDDKEKPVNMAHGGVVPGRAHFLGDHPGNDTVIAKLSPDEIVIPRSFAHDRKLANAYVDYVHRMKEEQQEGKKS